MIENSDRGITIAKPLAWTMVTGLILGSIWVGQTTGQVRGQLDSVASSIDALEATQGVREARDREDRRSFEDRLRAVETNRVQDSSELSALRRDLTSFRDELKEATSLLRQAIASPDVPQFNP
jgi:hypothetical protein